MDRYDFMSTVDCIFKECTSVEDIVARYTQMRKDIDEIYRQNVMLKIIESEVEE